MNTKFKNALKKLLVAVLTASVLMVGNPYILALAYEIPSAPTSPEAPEAPSAPTPPPSPDAPTLEEMLAPSPTSTPEESNEVWSKDGEESSGSSTELSESQSATQTQTGEVSNGQIGDSSIDTGDATNTVNTTTVGNNNYSATPASSGDGGVTIINDANGSDSTNSGSATITQDNNTFQDNSANVTNDLNQTTTTGDNSASENVGNSTITTGDANTSGTIVTAVNTNVDGVAVAEFNIADDHIGDIILDFSSACISGCLGGDTSIENVGNGSSSSNTGSVDSTINNNTFQSNDAVIENNVLLAADSGNNVTDNNTGGDSSIETGDANVSASILNFANNNLAGDVVYAVVNIFGNLVGDIIFPDGSILPCCLGDILVENSANGSNSQNSGSVDQTTNNNLSQFNSAEIDNNLVLSGTTGDNSVSDNTGGDSSITTGDSSITAQVLNIANLNLVGGNYWLVLVNEAGRWIGRILGAPDGANIAGSEGFEFIIDENGEIVVINSGNGSGSTNTGSVNQETNNTIVQENNAHIVNNINLSANTGENSASRNTGGNSSINTGDADVVANIVNFVNNNIVGTGRLFVTVINVFGSWIGDFVSPGHAKENNQESPDSGQGAIGGGSSGGGSNSATSNSSQSQGSTSGSGQASTSSIFLPTPTLKKLGGILLASASLDGGDTEGELADSGGLIAGESTGKKTIKINLAWLLPLIPGGLAILLIRRKRLLRKA